MIFEYLKREDAADPPDESAFLQGGTALLRPALGRFKHPDFDPCI